MAKWTALVYMGTDNLDTETDLSDAARDDIVEMKRVGSKEDALDIVVQIDDKATKIPRRLHIEKNDVEVLETLPQSANMASPKVLEEFLAWSLKKFKADHYLLIFWGHAYRYAFGPDATSGGEVLDYKELSTVLKRFKEQRKGTALEILGFDACGVSSIEVAYQFRQCVEHLVASEVGESFLGWPYEAILGRIWNNSGISAEELSRAIVDDYLREAGPGNVMLTALDLSAHKQILEGMRNLSVALGAAVADPAERMLIAACFMVAQFTRRDPLVDVKKLCETLSMFSGVANVRDAAVKLHDFLTGGELVIALDRRGAGTVGLGGVSAYAPHVATAAVRREIDERYGQLDLSQPDATVWPLLVEFLDAAT